MVNRTRKTNKPKDQVRLENKKRLYFVLKLAVLVIGFSWRLFFEESFESLHLDGNILPALFYYFTSIVLISFARTVFVYLYLRRKHKESDFKDNFILAVNRIASMLQVLMLIISVLYFFNVETKQFFTSISIVAAAIAIISREYIVNVINGFIMMFSNQFSLSDYIKVGEYSGRIMDITLMNVVLLNDDDEIVYVPNALVASSTVVNSSKKNFKKLSFDFELLPEAISSVDDLEAYITEALKGEFPKISLEKFSLKIESIKKDAVVLKLHITLDRRQKDLERPVRRFVNKSILAYSKDIKNRKED
ncbi:mechanosensitive ion channel-like protein [Roseivirga pacifica]|uniref:Mechanosensitive ion channel n=1 Tax=Roseivirga pacifica TaxID=1267423 RepID=A0A1I0NDZ4_9BACT|nr:mechanosensitive ion channel domain-containing protein [Roseivirga pacifica]MCO6359641.1 mechanosensitive ion channel [Roseivirga pacifica]MCO6367011.1 mechanosensitive ion channel [Roseivirga pacifica]MCO6370457.1 mechanosensitive ion channel [Roseivirga pacifica]MCO6374668.1 mechanosensitive ion channel [Roseivirga pacifica]MCO6379926.1 mechanosensitive ion channel [Roseivirga pacifica]